MWWRWFFRPGRYFLGLSHFVDQYPRATTALYAGALMTSEFITSERRTHRAFVSLLVACTFIVSGCGEGGAPPSGEPDSPAALAVEESEGPLVPIDLDEYVVLMDPVVPAGAVTLKLVNGGFEEHNLLFVVVESDSTVWETERRLAPGERRTVTLEFEPGAYKAVCDFSGHEGRGMFTEFLVEETTAAESGTER